MGTYNWTEIERYDATDLQLLLKDLEAHTKYEILLQAYNQFGRGPVAKIEAETGTDGKNKISPHLKENCFKKYTKTNLTKLTTNEPIRRAEITK